MVVLSRKTIGFQSYPSSGSLRRANRDTELAVNWRRYDGVSQTVCSGQTAHVGQGHGQGRWSGILMGEESNKGPAPITPLETMEPSAA